MQSLENIDDDADRQDIHLVKTTDRQFADEYGIEEMPGLVFFYRLWSLPSTELNQIVISKFGDIHLKVALSCKNKSIISTVLSSFEIG